MSCSNPRRTPGARGDAAATASSLSLKASPSLPKGATFHSLPSPPTSPAWSKVPSLPPRSQSSLDDVVDAHIRRAAINIGDFDKILAAAGQLPSCRPYSDDCSPVPQVVLDNTTMSAQDTGRRVLRSRTRRSRHQVSDSGLGTSVTSASQKKAMASPGPTGASAITRSVTRQMNGTARLSERTTKRIQERILQPLLAEPSLKDFRPIVLDCPRRIQEGQIVCLRDLEKTLLFMAPEQAKTADLFLEFCRTSIRCLQATVEQVPEHEQTRPDDPRYSSGYFIDLVEQINLHAQQMREANEKRAAGGVLDEMATEPTDEVKLMGGIARNGRPAELVRVKKNGKAVSLRTGEPIEDIEDKLNAPATFKRELSASAEDPEEVLRSMARRKKNPTPEELAPKKCKHLGCTKEFKRPCDLTKHEKTHSRPWKCPEPKCKYAEFGWPTEKEMDRHYNDKHLDTPNMFECKFKPCPYKSKRESNCKQHMEKAHGWVYQRTKTNGKKGTASNPDTSLPTPVVHNLPTPVSENSVTAHTPQDNPFIHGESHMDFPTYPSHEQFNAEMLDAHAHAFDDGMPPLDLPDDFTSPEELSSPAENGTPSTSNDMGQFHNYQGLSPEFTGQFNEDIYGAHVQLPTASHYATFANAKMFDATMMDFVNTPFPPAAVPTTVSAPAPHISPAGHGNTMLYTPESMLNVDEGFGEGFDENVNGQQTWNQFDDGDFMIFPPNSKAEPENNLFDTIPPSLAAGFSQPTSQDFNMEYNQPMDWPADFGDFPTHQ